MELTQLQIFVAVAEEKSITNAARRLFTTPSSISAQIKALEDEWDVLLFTRTTRGMQITEKGQHLLEKARVTLQSVHDLVNHATQMRAYLMGDINLGVNASLAFLRTAQWISRLQQDAPGIALQLHHLASGVIIERILSEQLDIGFVFGAVEDSRLWSLPLTTAQLCVVAPAAWQLPAYDWQTLSGYSWICSDGYCPFQTIIEAVFKEHLLPYRSVIKTNDEVSRAQLVRAGVGLSLLEFSEAQAEASEGHLQIVGDYSFPCLLSLVCLQYRTHNPLIATLCEIVEQSWRD